MPKIVTHQAKLKCPHGSTQGWLQIIDANRPTIDGKNIAATGIPQPCVPSIVTPWVPPCLETVNGIPMLLDNCKCMCVFGGVITIENPGQSGNVTGKLS